LHLCVQAKASVQTSFSRILESVRNREVFLLNQIDVIYQSFEDLLTNQQQQLLLKGFPGAHSMICSSEENRSDISLT